MDTSLSRTMLPDVIIDTCFKYFVQMMVLADAWGKVGCFLAPAYLKRGTKVFFIRWVQAYNYCVNALDAAVDSEDSAEMKLEWIRTRDLVTRTRMAELMRQ